MSVAGIRLDYVGNPRGALGSSSGARINILSGLTPATEFAALAHEYALLCSAVRFVRSGQDEIAPARPCGAP